MNKRSSSWCSIKIDLEKEFLRAKPDNEGLEVTNSSLWRRQFLWWFLSWCRRSWSKVEIRIDAGWPLSSFYRQQLARVANYIRPSVVRFGPAIKVQVFWNVNTFTILTFVDKLDLGLRKLTHNMSLRRQQCPNFPLSYSSHICALYWVHSDGNISNQYSYNKWSKGNIF